MLDLVMFVLYSSSSTSISPPVVVPFVPCECVNGRAALGNDASLSIIWRETATMLSSMRLCETSSISDYDVSTLLRYRR
jgi:hypothetical protein